MAILTTSSLECGDKVTRGPDRGVIVWPINSHWADVLFTRSDGTAYCERAYLPECKRVNKMKRAA